MIGFFEFEQRDGYAGSLDDDDTAPFLEEPLDESSDDAEEEDDE